MYKEDSVENPQIKMKLIVHKIKCFANCCLFKQLIHAKSIFKMLKILIWNVIMYECILVLWCLWVEFEKGKVSNVSEAVLAEMDYTIFVAHVCLNGGRI